MSYYDFAVVGAGSAGASLAAELGEGGASVLLLEAEERPGYHATGRSAAVLCRLGLVPTVLDLSVASADFFYNPPEGFTEYPLIRPTGILVVFKAILRTHICQHLAECIGKP